MYLARENEIEASLCLDFLPLHKNVLPLLAAESGLVMVWAIQITAAPHVIHAKCRGEGEIAGANKCVREGG